MISRPDIRNRVPFDLPEGQRLRALAALTVFLPPQITNRFSSDMPMSSLLRLSNDQARIGVAKGPQGEVSAIIVEMQAGDEITLGCSAQIAVDGVPEGQTAFEQLD